MRIYEAYIYDGDYYEPEHQIGIYNNLETAKGEVQKASQYLEELYIYVLELQGNEFKKVETWSYDKNEFESEWKCEKED